MSIGRVIEELLVKIGGDDRGFLATSRKVRGEAKALGSTFSGLQKTLGIALGGVTVGAGIHKVIASTTSAQDAMAQLQARIKSTGGAAGWTVGELDALAQSLQRTTIFSDEATKGAESLLLTFKSIRGENFRRATEIVQDLAQALAAGNGGVPDLKSAALQVGKALEDPATQMSFLRRSGVSFTAEQMRMAKQLQETGDLAGAQAIVLNELQTEFGGAAAAARDTLGGALAYLSNQWADSFELSGTASAGIVAAINDIGDAVPGVRKKLNDFFSTLNLVKVLEAEFSVGVPDMGEDALKAKAASLAAEIDRLRAFHDENLIGGIFESTETEAASKTVEALEAVLADVNTRIREHKGAAKGAGAADADWDATIKELNASLVHLYPRDLFSDFLTEGVKVQNLAQAMKDGLDEMSASARDFMDVFSDTALQHVSGRIGDIINKWAATPRSADSTLATLDAINAALAAVGRSIQDLPEWLQQEIERVKAGLAPTTPTQTSFFGGLKDQVKSTFNVETIVSTAFGNLLSGGLSTILSGITSGLGSFFSGLFGGNDAAQRQAEILAGELKANSERIADLSMGIDELAGVIGGQKGSTVSGVVAALTGYLDAMANFQGGFDQGGEKIRPPRIGAFLAQAGISYSDLEALAESLGITLTGTIAGFQQLLDAVTAAQQGQFKGFSGGWDLLQKKFDLLDISDPMEQFKQEIDFVSGLVGGDLARTLQGLDASNLDAFISDFLDQLQAGTLDFAQLGSLTPDQFLSFLSAAESGLDGLADATEKATSSMLNVPTGYKVALARFNATIAEPAAQAFAPRSDPISRRSHPSTGLSDAADLSGVVIHGDLVLQGVQNVDQLMRELEKKVQWQARTGGGVLQTVTG